MAVLYRCDQCGAVAESVVGWFQNDVTCFATVDTPFPGARGVLGTPSTFYFDKVDCRDAWLTVRGIPLPVEPPPVTATLQVPGA
jgi:hypothetical protein